MNEPTESFNEKIIKHIIMKYNLGDIKASCIYFDVLTALQLEEKKNVNHLKASIPDGIEKWLDIKKGDTLEWKFETIENQKHVAIVSKKALQSYPNVKGESD